MDHTRSAKSLHGQGKFVVVAVAVDFAGRHLDGGSDWAALTEKCLKIMVWRGVSAKEPDRLKMECRLYWFDDRFIDAELVHHELIDGYDELATYEMRSAFSISLLVYDY